MSSRTDFLDQQARIQAERAGRHASADAAERPVAADSGPLAPEMASDTTDAAEEDGRDDA